MQGVGGNLASESAIVGDATDDRCSLLNTRESRKLPACPVYKNIMSNSDLTETVTRPTECPFCKGKAIDTLAKVLTVRTMWRCRKCEQTWTIATLPPTRLRGR